MIVEGRCYCGAIRYRAEGDPVFRGQCHCRECQYISGGGPNYVLGMPADGFRYVQGTPKEFRRPDLENPVTREFCPECGTHLVSRVPGMPVAMLKVGTLNDPAAFGGPELAIYTIDRQPFHVIPEGLPTFERLPG